MIINIRVERNKKDLLAISFFSRLTRLFSGFMRPVATDSVLFTDDL